MSAAPDTDTPTPGEGGGIVTPLELSVGTEHGPQQRRNHMLPDPRIPRLCSVTDAANLLNVSRQYVWQLINEERLPAVQVSQIAILAEETVLEFGETRQRATETED